MMLQRLISDTRANVLLITGAALPLLVGAAGLVTDSASFALARRQLQQEADAAAISGASAKAQSGNITAAATKEITAMNKVALFGSVTVENAPTSGAYAGDVNAIRVLLTAKQKLAFSSLFLPNGVTINVQATAKIISVTHDCVRSLDTSTASGITFQGSASVILGCGLAANSTGPTAISAGGSAYADVTSLSAPGSIPASSNFSPDAKIYPHSLVQPDPYASLPIPQPTGCSNNGNVNPNQTKTLSPGCYSGMDIKGTVNLQPGIYYIDGSGGGLSFGSQAVVNGTGVTFILTSTTAATNYSSIAAVDINGGAMLNLSATITGTYAGVLFYQDRRALDSGSNLINGNSTSFIQGAIYFPKQTLSFSGNSGMSTSCLQLVGKRVSFSGNTTISNNCPSNSGASAFDGSALRLVG